MLTSQQKVINIYDPSGEYGKLSNNYVTTYGDVSLKIDGIVYTSVSNYIYSNLVQDDYNKRILVNYKPTETPNIYIKYRELFQNEIFNKLTKSSIELGILSKIESFPEFKKELFKIKPNVEIIYNTESMILGIGNHNNGLNLYGKVMAKIISEITKTKSNDMQKIQQENKASLIYMIYNIYNYLLYNLMNGKDIIKFKNNTFEEILMQISNNTKYNIQLKKDSQEVIVHKYNKSELNNMLIREINRILDSNSKSISDTFIYGIRQDNIEVAKTRRLIYKNDIIIREYIIYIIKKKYASYIPEEDSDTYFISTKNKLFESLAKDKQQKLINRLIDLYDLGGFDSELQKNIDFKLQDYPEIIEENEIIKLDESSKSEASSSSSSSSSSSPSSISSYASKSLVASSEASTVSPLSFVDSDDEISNKRRYKTTELRPKSQNVSEVMKDMEDMFTVSNDKIYINANSILSANYEEENKFFEIEGNMYPTIIHFIIKKRFEYLLRFLNNTEKEISDLSYKLITYNGDFTYFGIFNSLIDEDLSLRLTSTFIDITTLNYVFNRVEYVIMYDVMTLLCQKALDMKFTNKRLLSILLSTGNNKIVNNDAENNMLGTGNNYVDRYEGLSNTQINEYLTYGNVSKDMSDIVGKYIMYIRDNSKTSEIRKEISTDKLLVGIEKNAFVSKWVENKTKDILNIINGFTIYLNNKYDIKEIEDSHIYYIILTIFENCKDLYTQDRMIEPPSFYVKMYTSLARKYEINNENTIVFCWKFIYNILDEVLKNKLQLEQTIIKSQKNITANKKCKKFVDEDNCILSAIIHVLYLITQIQKYLNLEQTIDRNDIDLAVKIILSLTDIEIEPVNIYTNDDVYKIRDAIISVTDIDINSEEILLYIYNSVDFIDEYMMDSEFKLNRINYFAYGEE